MKSFVRLNRYKTHADPLSAFLSGLRYEIAFFSNWPDQDHKTLTNIVSTNIKLILQERGESEITLHDARLCCGAGSAVLIPPYTVYSAKTHENVNSFEIFFNIVPVTREQEFLARLGASKISQYAGLLTPTDFDLLRSIYADMQDALPGAYAQLHAFITMLLVRILRAQQVCAPVPATSPKEQAVIERVLSYLDAHIGDPVHVEDICEALQLSQSYLYRCSRDVMHCSTREMITRHKMNHAKTLLKDPEMTIAEVAEAVGYDPYHFSNQFKKSFLKSPSAYRAQMGQPK